MDKETLLAPPTYFAFLYIPLEIVHLPFENRRAVYAAALGNDEFDVHYRGVMSWLIFAFKSSFFFYAEYPPELARLGPLFSVFLRNGVLLYRRVHKKLSKIGPRVPQALSFSEIVDRHDGYPDKYILEGPVIPHSTYFTHYYLVPPST